MKLPRWYSFIMSAHVRVSGGSPTGVMCQAGRQAGKRAAIGHLTIFRRNGPTGKATIAIG